MIEGTYRVPKPKVFCKKCRYLKQSMYGFFVCKYEKVKYVSDISPVHGMVYRKSEQENVSPYVRNANYNCEFYQKRKWWQLW